MKNWDEIPKWVEWVAVNNNGEVVGFDKEPFLRKDYWVADLPYSYTYLGKVTDTKRNFKTKRV